jgi:hypothetical protein
MLSLSNTRQWIFKNKAAVAVFAFFFLATALSAGFIHNHAGDPFHTKEHNSCPVSVWAHTPFNFVTTTLFNFFALLLTWAVYLALAKPFIPKYFLTRSPRGPPIISTLSY